MTDFRLNSDFGFETFHYTLKDVKRIGKLLDCNGGDIVKVFEIMWRHWRDPRPNFLLQLIDKVKRFGPFPKRWTAGQYLKVTNA